ncbi:NAD(P)-binding protein [Meredithblackwellia eburnea MCA 4105]
MTTPPPLKEGANILITGATSGIGRGLAELFATSSAPKFGRVYVTGRRQDNLDELEKKYSNVTGINHDSSDLASIPELARKIVEEFKIDLLICNAGIQRGIDFTSPNADFSAMEKEMTLNCFAPVTFIKEVIQLSKKTDKPITIASVTSGLSMAPAARCPSYCASKAALRSYLIAIRRQLEDEKDAFKVSIVDLCPPLVRTELHDVKHQPEYEGVDISANEVPLDVYCKDSFDRLVKGGEDEIGYGFSAVALEKIGKAQRHIANTFPARLPSAKST